MKPCASTLWPPETVRVPVPRRFDAVLGRPDCLKLQFEQSGRSKITLIIRKEYVHSRYWFKGKDDDPTAENIEQLHESRAKVLALADFIVPGHGPIFQVH